VFRLTKLKWSAPIKKYLFHRNILFAYSFEISFCSLCSSLLDNLPTFAAAELTDKIFRLFSSRIGDGEDCVLVSLRYGAVSVHIGHRRSSGSVGFDTEIKPTVWPPSTTAHNGSTVGFNDNQWHSLAISRESREVRLQLTGILVIGSFILYNTDLLFFININGSFTTNGLL